MRKLLLFSVTMLCGILVSAQAILFTEDFEDCQEYDWISVRAEEDSDPDDEWQCEMEEGRTFIFMNGFSGGADEDWLISPVIDLDDEEEIYFSFDFKNVFEGRDIEFYVSTDFEGDYMTDGLSRATWNQIELDLYDVFQDDYVFNALPHPALRIAAEDAESLTLAFRYQSSATQSERWEVDNTLLVSDYYTDLDEKIEYGLRCEELKNEVHRLIRGHRTLEYSASDLDVWDAYYMTDRRQSDDGQRTIVYDMTTDNPDGPETYEFTLGEDRDSGSGGGSEGQFYNRDHVLPRSWWGGGDDPIDTMFFDLHNLVPSDKYLNNQKSFSPIGVTGNPNVTSSNGTKIGPSSVPGFTEKVYEPIDAYKGDYARIYFYMATRYGPRMKDWESNSETAAEALSGDIFEIYEPWLLDVLLAWHELDPVSDKERQRNDAIYSFQRNRNPFVDRPELVEYIWQTFPCFLSTEDDEDSEKRLVLYPNPAEDRVEVNLPEGYQVKSIEVYDQQGRKVDSMTRTAWDISEYATGVYQVMLITTDNEVFLDRFWKLR